MDGARLLGLIIGLVLFIGGPMLAMWALGQAVRAVWRRLFRKEAGKVRGESGRPGVSVTVDNLNQRWSSFK